MRRAKFHCLDCAVDTGKINEYYMVVDHLWEQAGVEPQGGMLCVGCLEDRIGRRLTGFDFTQCYVNRPQFGPQSDRLRSRMEFAL